MFISNRKATIRGGISYHFKGMFNFYRSITSVAPSIVSETFGVSGLISNTIGVSTSDISEGLGVSGTIIDTIGVSSNIG